MAIASSARSAVTTRTLDAIAPVADVSTQFRTEAPYGLPAGWPVLHVQPGQRLSPQQLDPRREYLWSLQPDGELLVAPKGDVQRPDGSTREIKHGDLNPTPDHRFRGPARLAGEILGPQSSSGQFIANQSHIGSAWFLDDNGSATHHRLPAGVSPRYAEDGPALPQEPRLPADALRAFAELYTEPGPEGFRLAHAGASQLAPHTLL